jgi:hypothetical protein
MREYVFETVVLKRLFAEAISEPGSLTFFVE